MKLILIFRKNIFYSKQLIQKHHYRLLHSKLEVNVKKHKNNLLTDSKMVLSPTKVNSLNLMVKKPLPTGCTAKEFPTNMNVLMNMKLQMKIIVSTNPIFISQILICI